MGSPRVGRKPSSGCPPSWSQQHLLPYTDCHSSGQQQAPYAHDKDRRASTAIRSRCAKGRATTTMGCTREKRRRMGHLQSSLPSIADDAFNLCGHRLSPRGRLQSPRTGLKEQRAQLQSPRAPAACCPRARLQSPAHAPASTSHLQSPERWPPIDG